MQRVYRITNGDNDEVNYVVAYSESAALEIHFEISDANPNADVFVEEIEFVQRFGGLGEVRTTAMPKIEGSN